MSLIYNKLNKTNYTTFSNLSVGDYFYIFHITNMEIEALLRHLDRIENYAKELRKSCHSEDILEIKYTDNCTILQSSFNMFLVKNLDECYEIKNCNEFFVSDISEISNIVEALYKIIEMYTNRI